jgi:hypothetical protein
MSFNKITFIAAVSASAISSFSYAGSAQAISFSYTPGAFRTPSVTNEGAFSENVNNKKYVTIDFNSKDKNGKTIKDNGLFKGNDLVNYTFSKGSYATSVTGSKTGIISDNWAPAGVNGEVNQSNYLAVFKDSSVSIKLKQSGVFNYFGLDVGALSGGNTFELLKGGTTVGKWTYEQLNNIAKVVGTNMSNQKNGFFEFLSTSNEDNFDDIKLSQAGGGGFESDNHTFHIGFGAYNIESVPAPTAVFGLMAVGGIFLRKSKNQKSDSVKESA